MTAKQDEKLDLRAAPGRKLVRFKKGVVIGGAAIASAGILGVTMLALQAPTLRNGQPTEELYNTDKKPTPDGLAALPGDYSEVKLGPPLPGDLGRPILERQRQFGIAPGGKELSAAEQRLASQAIQAKEAGVFFRIENRPQQNAPAATAQPMQTAAVQPDAGRLTLDPERDQNNQQRKLDFLHQQDEGGIYNPHALQTPASPHQVMAGSVIAASLITGINSDLPGLVVAQVTENLYDTVTGQILLIPQGARLIGTYDSVVAFGQSRALLVWQRIILPDGSSIQIDNLPASDAAGYAGLEDDVDYHTWQLLKGIAMATLLGVGTELSFGSNENDLVSAIRESTQANAAQAGQRITEKNLNIQPTITIRPSWPLRVIVQKDIVLRPYKG
ncbi:TrbI/VirB10 family protein [Thalassospira sp.]|uniref:TrbI/VirB10 family protein n=1 Tax=Thalassospira sp. TaxID=1912094 RepID=UPI0032EF0AAF